MMHKTDSYINNQKAINIKLLVSDNDGVFTNGSIYVFRDIEDDLQRFNVLDGASFAMLQAANITTAIISGRNSSATANRFKKLRADYVYLGIENKLEVLTSLVAELNLSWAEVAYIGDDLIDVECLKMVGFAAAPQNAIKEVKKIVHYICKTAGGDGVFREVTDYILQAQNAITN